MKIGRTLTAKGLSPADRAMFLAIGKAAGTQFIIARGSRVKGYAIKSSDYDCIIWLPASERVPVTERLNKFMARTKLKVDFQVNQVAHATDGIMLEITE